MIPNQATTGIEGNATKNIVDKSECRDLVKSDNRNQNFP